MTQKIYCILNAEEAEEKVGTFGYCSNNLASLEEALKKERTNLSVFYTRLDSVLGRKSERRFCTKNGNFALFCPLDLNYEEKRY